MLVIRNAQIEAFKQARQAQFQDELASHFMAYYPNETRLAGGKPQILKLVRLGIEKAARHGYTTQRQIGFYIGLMAILGSDFDRDPQLPWAIEQVDDASIPNPSDRIRSLFHASVRYLGAIGGDDKQVSINALRRLREYAQEPASPVLGEAFEEGLCAQLAAVCPEKFAFQGEAATRALIRESLVLSGQFGILDTTGATLLTILMYLLGIGASQDPLYPWVGQALNLPLGGEEKAGLFRQAVLAYCDQTLPA